MSDPVDRTVAHMEGSIQLPRKNGELVFESPWEARAFGIAVALSEADQYPWRVFGEALANEVRRAEDEQEDSTYYERWLRALCKVAVVKGLVSEEQILERARHTAVEDDHHH